MLHTVNFLADVYLSVYCYHNVCVTCLTASL